MTATISDEEFYRLYRLGGSDIEKAATTWRSARSAVLALTLDAPDYRDKLNRLSNAEDALSRAVAESQNV